MENTPTNKLTLLGIGTMLVSAGGMSAYAALQTNPIVIINVVGSGIVVAIGFGILWAREQIKIPKGGK